MTTIINAVSGTGLTQSADGSGVVKLQSNGKTTNALAWVNFDGTGTGTLTPRANYNVSSITKASTGVYTLNFTNTLTDANYAFACSGSNTAGNSCVGFGYSSATQTASSLKLQFQSLAAVTDYNISTVVVFGN